jgi:ABC-type transport system substrate-binding protein
VSDPNIDALLEQAGTESDTGKRTQLYQDLQRLLVKGVYTVPLFLRPNLALVRPNIGNYYPNSAWSNIWNVGDWFLK